MSVLSILRYDVNGNCSEPAIKMSYTEGFTSPLCNKCFQMQISELL